MVAEMLLDTRGVQQDFAAHVVAIAFDGAGAAAFGLADGTLRIAAGGEWRTVEVADGAILDVARDAMPAGFVCSDDTGGFVRVSADGAISDVARWPNKWVEHVASFFHARDGRVACSVGRALHLFAASGEAPKILEHPSTVTGIAFDARGKRISASHYNGASVWFTASKSDNPRRLEWKGSHTAVAMHPDGDAVVTAMQENALHGWRLSDPQHMRMSGYPAKTESLSFTRSGKWLASSGAEAIVLWPFFGGGPMGKAPMELAGGRDILCTRVACNPLHDVCAAGFADGVVVVVDLTTQRMVQVAPRRGDAVSALAWDIFGAHLAFGTEAGFAALVDFSAR